MNLAEARSRDVQQLKQLTRKASIVPERRDTRQSDLEVNASMRDARRGDSGAGELMRALGIVQRAGNDLVEYSHAKHQDAERDNISRGFADEAVDAVDAERMEKSLGYRNAVTKGRTVTQFTEASREFGDELSQMIEQQDDPDLEVRRSQVLDATEVFFRDFAVDSETGELKQFMQSPGAMRYLAEAMHKSRPDIEAKALARIEERFNTEAVGHFSTNISDQIAETGLFDLEAARTLLPATVADGDMSEAVLVSASNGAAYLRSKGRLAEATALLSALRGYKDTVPVVPESAPAVKPKNGRAPFKDIAAAVMWQESRGNPNAVSPKGAVGTMQTMPATLKDPGYGVKPAKDDSPEERERVGKDYLKAMLREFNGDVVMGLAAYNAGPGAVADWVLKGSTKQRIAAIPFKETRDYVSNIMGRLGMVEGEISDSQDETTFRLARPGADPVTAFEQSGDVPKINGLDKLQFSPQQQARINAMYDQFTAEMRHEWIAQRREEQSHNASRFALGIFGHGEVVATAEITDAIRSGAIDPEDGMTLFRLQRSEQERRENALDRAEARADRAVARAQRQRVEEISGHFIGRILSGDLSGSEARSEALKALPSISDPVVQAGVANAVIATAGDIENLMINSEPARSAVTRLQDGRDHWLQIASRSGLRGTALKRVTGEVDSLLDQAGAELVMKIRDGMPAAQAEAEVVEKYRPKLTLATSRPSGPARHK